MRLAIIDLDGVIANREVAFAHAEEVKQAYMQEEELTGNIIRGEATNRYWRAVFDPEYVPTDTPIDGINEALLDLQHGDNGYTVVFLSSRPESMRDATAHWLFEHTVYDMDDLLILKPSAFQYTKTIVWKAGMVQTLSALYHASHVLVVDDEQANLDEIVKHALIPPVVPGLMIAHSLAEAVARLNGTWVEPDPFLPDFPE